MRDVAAVEVSGRMAAFAATWLLVLKQ